MRIFALDCPKCGASLKVTEHKEQISCGYCGSTLRVDRAGGTVSLELEGIKRGTDKTAAELALTRLRLNIKWPPDARPTLRPTRNVFERS